MSRSTDALSRAAGLRPGSMELEAPLDAFRGRSNPSEGPGVAGASAILRVGERKEILRVNNLAHPGLQTVMLAYKFEPQPDPALLLNLALPLVCELEFGIASVPMSAEFDVAQGVRLVVPADGIRLAVRYEARVAPAYQPPVRVSAAIAPGGSGPSNSQFGAVRRTFYFNLPGTTQSDYLTIPNFASTASVFCSTSPGTPAVFRQRSDQNGTIAEFDASSIDEVIPILNGMPRFSITNPLAVAGEFRAVFNLAL